MTTVPMIKFGRTLTDRPDGQKAFHSIVEEYKPPYHLDFRGVMSLGSSFGDEVVVKLASQQNNEIEVSNANDGIRACLRRVVEGTEIRIREL